MLRQIYVALVGLIIFLAIPSIVFAADTYSFTASNVSYNTTTTELKFTASSINHPTGSFTHGGISNCNIITCAGPTTEFWNFMDVYSYSDPIDYDQTLFYGGYRPGPGNVYVWLGDGIDRWYSQPLDYSSIAVSQEVIPDPNAKSFTASSVHYDASTGRLLFLASNIKNLTSGIYTHGGISNNTSVANQYTEFWNFMDTYSKTDSLNYDQTLFYGVYRPSQGTVYVWLGDGFDRWYS